MKKCKIFLWIAVLLLLQTCVLPYIKIRHVGPELLFVFSVCYALHEKDQKLQFFVPVICGAAVDWMSGQFFGADTVIYMLAAAAAVWLVSVFYQTGTLFHFPLMLVLSIAAGSAYFLMHTGDFADAGYGTILWNMILPTALWNTLLTAVILPLVRITWKQRR